jgi:hypothetical protein
MPGPFLAALAMTISTGLSVRSETPPMRFTLGPVDLVTLALSMPPGGNPVETAGEAAPIRTLRDLHFRVDAFLDRDVEPAVERARWRLVAARRSAASGTGTNSFEGNPRGALLAVAVGSISYSMNTDLRDAKACLAFLEGLQRRARALADDTPEKDEAVTPDLIARWERLGTELRQNLSCRQRR